MKRIMLVLLSIFLVCLLTSCSETSAMEPFEEPAADTKPLPETESAPTATIKPTDFPPTPQPEEAVKDWPDALPFCRANPDKPEGESDCWVLKSDDEWLALEPVAGDEFATAFWPEGMELPALPEGLEWKKERRLVEKDNAGYLYFWVVVASESTISESQVPWPEAYFFCRSDPDDADGEVDCQRVSNVDEWLEIDIQIGEKLGIWPEGMPVPPLPGGMEWEKVRDPNIGEYFWVVVPAE